LANRAWDPFWEVCSARKLPVHFHIATSATAMSYFGTYPWASHDDDTRMAIGGTLLSPEIVSYLSTLYKERSQVPKAIALLEGLVARVPDSDKYHFMLGAMYDEAKEKTRVVEQMRKAIELNPKNAAALNYLGYTYAESGQQLDEAESLIRRALELEPDDGFFVDSLGWVYYQRGDFKTAIKHLERAVDLAGEDPTVIEHLGDAYQGGGRVPEALRAFRDAMARSKDPNQTERLKAKIQTIEAAGPAHRSSL
jgi:tetratricopeptide (TPR) repeat protein